MNLICKGCSNSGRHLFSNDGFCVCSKGREMKELHEARLDKYFKTLGKRKPVEEAVNCAQCKQLQDDNGTLRCGMFYGAKIENTADKHCEDSIH
ncbi:hypothetical protein [Paenibacillus sp. Pae108]|uniref:hypothetical protein n=1 Tax=Paenibacillus sp. Pae108 TaxID=2926019 RepID=UPI0021179575|nr:hypothetical protein [Paenibacillus sp. Pae108]